MAKAEPFQSNVGSWNALGKPSFYKDKSELISDSRVQTDVDPWFHHNF